MKKSILITSLLMSVSFLSCKEDTIVNPTEAETNLAVFENVDNGQNLNTRSAKLAATYNYSINMDGYRFIYQQDPNIYKTYGKSACVPTSYVIAKGILTKNKTLSAGIVNSSVVIAVAKAMGTQKGIGTNFGALETYAKKEFGSTHPSKEVYTSSKDAESRAKALSSLYNHLQKGFPVIVSVLANVADPLRRDDTSHVVIITGIRVCS